MLRRVAVPRNGALEVVSTVPRTYFFGNRNEDDGLEDCNIHFWRALLGHIKADGVRSARTLLDHGCHTGGLAALAAEQLGSSQIWAMEPVLRSRQQAEQRLSRLSTVTQINAISPDAWSRVPDNSIDLLLSHEVLYLVEDLPGLFQEVARVLGSQGAGYFVLGCHTENPAWTRWKKDMEGIGHQVYDHSPFDVLRAGVAANLSPALRPLRESGWSYYEPGSAKFSFESAQELFDHQFRHKLLFRFRAHAYP